MKSKVSLVAFVLLGICLVSAVFSYLAGHAVQGHLLTADTLYLPVLFSDLLARGGHIADWFLTPAPYLFPDYPIYFLAYLLGPDPYIQIPLYFCLQILLTAAAVGLLAQVSSAPKPFFLAAVTAICLLWLALIAGDPFYPILTSAYHYGIFLCAIVLVALCIKGEASACPRTFAALLAVASALAFLATLSDNLFIVQAIAPLVATGLCMALLEKSLSRRRLLVIFLPAVSALLGSLSYSIVVAHKTRYPTTIGLDKMAANLMEVGHVFIAAIASQWVYGLLLLCYVGLVAVSLYQLVRKKTVIDVPRPLLWLALFSFMSLGATLATLALVTNLQVAARYLLAPLLWPVIVVPLFLSQLLGRRFWPVAILLSLLATLSLGLAAYGLVQKNGWSGHYYPEDVACIDRALGEEGATNGVAQYWDAKYLHSFSRLHPNIAQYTANLDEMHWITSKSYFRERYDFAAISGRGDPSYRISVEALSRLNAAPKRIVQCGDTQLYMYGKNGMRAQNFSDPGDFRVWTGCDLPTGVGEKTAGCEIQTKAGAGEGFLTFGPYEMLPAGRYGFEIDYSSPVEKDQAAGTWDVVITMPEGLRPLAEGVVSGSGGESGKIKAAFTIGPELHLGRLEVRTRAGRDMTLKIASLRLERLQ